MGEFHLETVTAEPFGYIRLEASMPQMPHVIGEGFARLAEIFGKANAEMAGAPYAHYLSFENGLAVFELGFPIRASDAARLQLAGATIGLTPDGQVLKAIHLGPYETVSQTYDEMTADLSKRGLIGRTDMWERYFSPPGTPPAKIRTEVIWPIASGDPVPARPDARPAPVQEGPATSRGSPASRFVHVDISADDPGRAATFYKSVFGWKIDELPGPVPYLLVATDPSDPAAIGAGIGKRTEPWQHVSPTIQVASADEVVARLVAAGGAIVTPKAAVPGVGQLVTFRDTEGNILTLLEPESPAGPARPAA